MTDKASIESTREQRTSQPRGPCASRLHARRVQSPQRCRRRGITGPGGVPDPGSALALNRDASAAANAGRRLQGVALQADPHNAYSIPSRAPSGGPRAFKRSRVLTLLLQVLQNLPDHHRLLDAGDDLHRPAGTARSAQHRSQTPASVVVPSPSGAQRCLPRPARLSSGVRIPAPAERVRSALGADDSGQIHHGSASGWAWAPVRPGATDNPGVQKSRASCRPDTHS